MSNHPAIGRHLAARLLSLQLAAAALAGLLFLTQGWRSTLAAVAGAMAVAAGNALMACRALTSLRAGAALLRFLTGVLLKWITVAAGLYLLLVCWRLPPAPMIAGLLLALVAQLLMFKYL